MSRSRSVVASVSCVLALARVAAFADESPALIKVRLQGGRSIVAHVMGEA